MHAFVNLKEVVSYWSERDQDMFSTLNSLDSVTVCVTVIDKFEKTLKDEDRKDGPKLEKLFMKFCKDLRGKEERFVSTYRIFFSQQTRYFGFYYKEFYNIVFKKCLIYSHGTESLYCIAHINIKKAKLSWSSTMFYTHNWTSAWLVIICCLQCCKIVTFYNFWYWINHTGTHRLKYLYHYHQTEMFTQTLNLLFQCYYIGGLKTSATYILGTMSKPMKSFMPSTKICEKLRDADNQICDLKYGKCMDLFYPCFFWTVWSLIKYCKPTFIAMTLVCNFIEMVHGYLFLQPSHINIRFVITTI